MPLFILTIMSCGRAPDPTFDVYQQRFVDAAAARGVSVPHRIEIQFGDPGSSFEAYCRDGHIIVDRAKWETKTDAAREVLIFHELGHCVLGRSHVDCGLDPSTIYCSVMTPIPPPYATYSKNREYFINELFSH